MQILRPDAVVTPQGVRVESYVTLAHGRIVDVADEPRHPDLVEELPGRILLPGLVNAHSHAFQRAIRGRVQRVDNPQDDFWSWRTAMYGVANGLDAQGVLAVSRLAFLEMALAGVTAVGEFHYLHHDRDGRAYADPDELAHRVIEAALDVGIRIALLRVVYARKEPGVPLSVEQRRFRDADVRAPLAAVERLSAHADPRVSVGLAPHSVRAVPPQWLAALAGHDLPLHAHVAEQPREVALCLDETGRSPLACFDEAGLVDAQFSAVHLTWPSDGDLELLAARSGGVVVCPTTELDLADGLFPAEQWRGRTAVGSDSHARVDLLEEARLVEGLARARSGRRGVWGPRPAQRVIDMATAHGAEALGLGSGIAPGAPADLVAIDASGPGALGVEALDHAAYGGTAARDVWVAGERIVRDGRHADAERIVAEARAAMAALPEG